jgi:hypothetical protein
MGDIVNLRRARKAKEKSSANQKAEENRRLFGQTLAEKNLRKTQALIEDRRFDGHLLVQGAAQEDPAKNGE